MTRRQRSYPVAPPGLWDREDMRSALAARDMGAVITIFRRWTGASQTDTGVLIGMPQPHVSDFERGIRHATSLAMFERLWAWPALTDIPYQGHRPGEDVHHGDHGTQATSRAPVVHS
jgi:hypothetical protein